MGLTDIGMEDRTRVMSSLQKVQGSSTLLDGGIVLACVYISNDGGDGLLQVVDAKGNKVDLVRITKRMDSREIYFNDLGIFWKNSELRLIKSNSDGEILVTVKYVKGTRIKLLDWENWNRTR